MKLKGTGISPEFVANTILKHAFTENIPVSPMKLQKLLYFTTCLYQRQTGNRLLTESFQPWKYGPVVRSVYDEFKGFGASPITQYALDAQGNAQAAAEEQGSVFTNAVDKVWNRLKYYTAIDLSKITHLPNSAWYQAVQNQDSFISNTAMANDHTFDRWIQ